MKCETRVALGVGAGYLLGRSHKMRWALMLAAAGAAGRLPGTAGELLERGTKVLESSPELSKLAETARERLVEPGKAALVAALNSQIDSLSEKLQTRADSQRQPSRSSGTAEEEEEAEQPRGRARPEEEEGYEEEYDAEEPQEQEEELEPKPVRERPVSRRGQRLAGPNRVQREAAEPAAGLEGKEPGPLRRRTARAAAAGSGSPIRRARR